MAKTLKECAIAALLARGEKELPRTAHYTVFTRTSTVFGQPLTQSHQEGSGRGQRYFIGVNGAIRVGYNATGSVPLAEKAKELLYHWGREKLEGRSVDSILQEPGVQS